MNELSHNDSEKKTQILPVKTAEENGYVQHYLCARPSVSQSALLRRLARH